MIYHYLKAYKRILKKNWLYTSIIIFGLSIGMASLLLSAKYIGYTLTFDEYYSNRDRIFHVDQLEKVNGNVNYDGSLSYRGVAFTSLRDVPGVENYTKFAFQVEKLILVEEEDGQQKSFSQTGIFSVDTSFAKIFNLKPIYGDLNHALDEPNSIIITQSIAKRYFGERDPTGNSIRSRAPWGSEKTLIVKCVVEDPPKNSTIKFNILVSEDAGQDDLWENPVHNQFLLLEDLENSERISKEISEIINELPIFKDNNREISISLDPLKSTFSKFEIFLVSVGGLIMILSWMSFSSLAIMQFMQRQKEVFIRRSVGASDRELARQYLFETGLIVFFSIVTTVLFLFGVYDYFSELAESHLLPLFSNKFYINTILIVIFLIGALLPSTYVLGRLLMSSENMILGEGKFSSKSGINKRRLLTGIQFGIAIFMITFSHMIDVQTQYLYDLDKGIDLDRKIIVKPPKDSRWGKGKRARTLRNELAKITWIGSVTSSSTIPGQPYRQEVNFSLFGSENTVLMYVNAGTREFFPTYDINILSGENFPSGKGSTNESKVLINKVSMKLLGLDLSNSVGQRVVDDNENVYTIIGVFENYHKTSPKEKIGPMIFMHNTVRGYFTINYTTQQIPDNKRMAELETVWKKVYADQPFDYFLLSTYYDNQFNNEDQLLRIMRIFSFIAIFLVCFNLIGLSLFETSNSKSEVGIRKAFGASSNQILFLFVKKYLILFLLVIIVSLPVIYYLMSQWLNEFSYRVEMKATYVFAPAMGLLILSLATIGFHIVRISRINA
ncbi:ABC transporter permease, partial [Ekhidna sp.]|uniref:ABC transporter permease n=1 Tax=Ekhidna sp. TaxID=2608089 RepID=UPI003299D1E4